MHLKISDLIFTIMYIQSTCMYSVCDTKVMISYSPTRKFKAVTITKKYFITLFQKKKDFEETEVMHYPINR